MFIYFYLILLLITYFLSRKCICRAFYNENFTINKKKCVVYNFKIGSGGMGDFLKFLKICYIFTFKNNINNFFINLDHPKSKYIIINDKYILKNKDDFKIINKKPFDFYETKINDLDCNQEFNILDFLDFSDEIKNSSLDMLNKENISSDYNGIHLRVGDQHFKYEIGYRNDNRIGNLSIDNIYEKIEKIINNDKNNLYIFFSENENYKSLIKKKNYKNIKIFDIPIIHTGQFGEKGYEYDKNLKFNICDFYLLTKCKIIHSFTNSGYPITASYFNNSKLIKYY